MEQWSDGVLFKGARRQASGFVFNYTGTCWELGKNRKQTFSIHKSQRQT